MGQLFRVACFEDCCEALGGRPFTGLLQQIRRDVDAPHLRALPRGGNGQIARAASHVQHARSRLDLQPIDENLGALGRIPRDLPEISGHPRAAHSLFELFEISLGRLHNQFFSSDTMGSNKLVLIACFLARALHWRLVLAGCCR